jgi:hypothetical protein
MVSASGLGETKNADDIVFQVDSYQTDSGKESLPWIVASRRLVRAQIWLETFAFLQRDAERVPDISYR